MDRNELGKKLHELRGQIVSQELEVLRQLKEQEKQKQELQYRTNAQKQNEKR